MDLSYLITPFAAWLTAGCLKFFVNSMRAGKLAFGLIGYGGFPSNHSSIVFSTTTLVAIKEGIAHPAFGVALTFAFIVILDASSLRRQVGKHATAINKLSTNLDAGNLVLRERIGHTPIEICAGIFTGILVGIFMSISSN